MTDDQTCDCHEQVLARLDRILELLEDRRKKAAPADGVYQVTIPPASRVQEYWEQRQIAEQWAADEGLETPPAPEAATYATGGLIEAPKCAPLIGRTGCVIPGYCPTHDGRLIAIRDGRLKDVTNEAIEVRMPLLDE